MSDLTDKSVIITGANSGIGEAAATLFAKKGANVTLCGRDTLRLQDAVKKCKDAATTAGKTGKFVDVAGDVTIPSVRAGIIGKTLDAFGRIDVLVASHGATFADDCFAEPTEEAFNKTFDVNVKSVFFLVQETVPHLEKTRGSVVVVSSFLSKSSSRLSPMYQISKAAVDHMVRGLALEHGPRGIRVNAVNPTLVANTRIFREMMPEKADAAPFHEHFDKEMPLKGHTRGPEEQAEVIVFLASDAARLISGESILVDGAMGCKGNPINFM